MSGNMVVTTLALHEYHHLKTLSWRNATERVGVSREWIEARKGGPAQ